MIQNTNKNTNKIYITRHGQTIWNIQKLYQGHLNSDLTPTGINQAMAIGKFLKDKNITQIYYSPLERVVQTKNLIVEQFEDKEKMQNNLKNNIQSIPQTPDDRLKECNYGELEGKSEATLHDNLLKIGIDRKDLNTKLNWKFPKGENYNQVFERVESFVSEILLNKNQKDQKIIQKTEEATLIVGHCGTTRCLWAILNNITRLEAMKYKPNNGELICYDTTTKLCEIIDFNKNILK